MFTGIVEDIGTIKKVSSSSIFQFTIEAQKVTENLNISDSICMNGVCLTVTKKQNRHFEVQVVAHTLEKTNLGLLKAGDKVNLERAILPSSFLGGHFVTGDIDGLVTLEKIESGSSQWTLTLKPPAHLKKYIVSQGRITIEGISLTVAAKEADTFKVCIIPHTLKNTTLYAHKKGDLLNLEVDILAKYVGEIVAAQTEKRGEVTLGLLKMARY